MNEEQTRTVFELLHSIQKDVEETKEIHRQMQADHARRVELMAEWVEHCRDRNAKLDKAIDMVTRDDDNDSWWKTGGDPPW